ncbi:MAG: anaerobic C4-dicarboxylate transporter family protein [Succinivibrio dextrinosolvens]|nr:anaerobic C4-dicarboxylate transporter family protein [Succinivibrio dextrinosolvens]
MLIAEFIFMLMMLYIGSRYGGIGLGVVSGIGILVEVFILRLSTNKCGINDPLFNLSPPF